MTTSEEELGTCEIFWKCGAGGTAKLLGVTHRRCPNCGNAQEASRRYFPSDDETIGVAEGQSFSASHGAAAHRSATSEMRAECNRPPVQFFAVLAVITPASLFRVPQKARDPRSRRPPLEA